MTMVYIGWLWCNFVPDPCQLVFCRNATGKTRRNVLVTVTHSVSKLMIHFLKPTDSILSEQHDESSTFNSTHAYLQQGERTVTAVMSLHPCIELETCRVWQTTLTKVTEACIVYVHDSERGRVQTYHRVNVQVQFNTKITSQHGVTS